MASRCIGSSGPARRRRARPVPGGPRPGSHWRREHSSCHRRRQARDLARRLGSGTDGLSRLRGNAGAMSTVWMRTRPAGMRSSGSPGSWPPSAAESRCVFVTLHSHPETSNIFPESEDMFMVAGCPATTEPSAPPQRPVSRTRQARRAGDDQRADRGGPAGTAGPDPGLPGRVAAGAGRTGVSVPARRARISPTVRSRPPGSGSGRCAWMW